MPAPTTTDTALSARLPAALAAELTSREWTRYRLARECGLPTTTVYAILDGSRVPTVDPLHAILTALGLPWSWLDTV